MAVLELQDLKIPPYLDKEVENDTENVFIFCVKSVFLYILRYVLFP